MMDGCEHYDDLLIRIASPGFVPGPQSGVSLVIRRSGSSRSSVGGKNGLRHLRPRASGVLRPQDPLDSGPVLWRYPGLLGGAYSACALSELPEGEAGAAGLAGRQPVVHQTFAFYVGRRCASSPIRAVARELHLDWHTVKDLEKQYMRAQLTRVGTPGPQVIGIDEVSIKKGHTYRIVVSDLVRRRPIWFGGMDRSEASMDGFYQWLGPRKSRKIRLAVMDMWKAFRISTLKPDHAPTAAILFDKFHVMRHLGKALDTVRKREYARLTGKDRAYIKGQKYTLLSRRAHLTLDGRKALHKLLAANKRLNTAYLLKESFGQLWDYEKEGWARRFFDNWTTPPSAADRRQHRRNLYQAGQGRPPHLRRTAGHGRPRVA